MLEAAVKNSGIEELIEKNFSVEAVGIFTPDFKVYQIAVDVLNVRSDEIVFQSSNAWDASGASALWRLQRHHLCLRPDGQWQDALDDGKFGGSWGGATHVLESLRDTSEA